jgi:hypothetical protein
VKEAPKPQYRVKTGKEEVKVEKTDSKKREKEEKVYRPK